MDELSELYQQVILDHCRNPRNFRVLPGATCNAEGNNPLCGDHFTIFLKLKNNVIQEVTFQGAGCCISKACCSIMSEMLKGKTVEEVKDRFAKFQQMVTTGQLGNLEQMGKLCAFSGVHHFPTRVKCATLPWHALLAGINGRPAASTEQEM
jgi:nitrogen fixation NifU-like protein